MPASCASRPGESRTVSRAADAPSLSRGQEGDRVAGRGAGTQHDAREPRRGRSLVPGDVPGQAVVQLSKEHVSTGDAPAVHDLRRGLEQNAPAVTAQPSGEIALFRVKKEALVEAPDLLEHGSADENRRALHRLDRVRARMVLPRRRVSAKRTAAAREKSQPELSQ